MRISSFEQSRAHSTEFSMDINPTQTKVMELEAMEAKKDNDDRDLARLGKSPVLKVQRRSLHIRYCWFDY